MRAPPLILALALASAAHGAEDATPPANAEPGLRDVRWELAPIRWRGLLATDLRSFRGDGQPARRELVESATLQGASYVYQPWFAQLAFGLTGLASQERAQQQNTRGSTLGGNGLVSIFPTSRFPFQASYERTDSRSSEQFTGRDYLVERAGARQSYRTLAGDSNSSLSFDRSTLSSDTFGRDTVDVWNASHARSFGLHSFDSQANRTFNDRGSGEHARFDRVFARHNYAAGGLATAETMASYGATSQSLAARPALHNEVTQVNAFATWRPKEGDPLFVTGGARLLQTELRDPAAETEARSLMAHGSANYQLSRNLTLNGGGSVTENSTADGSTVLSSEFAGATYTPDARRFGQYLYTSNLGAGATNQSGGEEGTRRVISAQATHGVNRLFTVSEMQSVALNGSQGVALANDNQSGDLRSLNHYGGLSWRGLRERLAQLRLHALELPARQPAALRPGEFRALLVALGQLHRPGHAPGEKRGVRRQPQRRRHLSAPAGFRRAAAALPRDLRAQRLPAQHARAGRAHSAPGAGKLELRAAARVPHRQARGAHFLPDRRDRWQEKCFTVPPDRPPDRRLKEILKCEKEQ